MFMKPPKHGCDYLGTATSVYQYYNTQLINCLNVHLTREWFRLSYHCYSFRDFVVFDHDHPFLWLTSFLYSNLIFIGWISICFGLCFLWTMTIKRTVRKVVQCVNEKYISLTYTTVLWSGKNSIFERVQNYLSPLTCPSTTWNLRNLHYELLIQVKTH